MPKFLIRLLVASCLAWCCITQISLAAVLELSSSESAEKMQSYLSLYKDYSASLPVELLMTSPEKFEPVETEFINADLTNAKIWLRFEMENTGVENGRWAIATGSMRIDNLSLYKLSNGSIERVYHSNYFSRGDEREIFSPNIYIPISLAAQSKATFFLEYQSQGTINLNLDVLDLQRLQERTKREYIFDFLLIGFFIALAAINLFHFAALRLPAHLYYSLLMLASVANVFNVRNYVFVYVFPDSLEMVRLFTPWVGSAAVLFGVLFTRHFFDLKTLSKPLYLASHISMALLIVPCIAVFFTSFNNVLSIMTFTSPQAILLMVSVGFYALYKGKPSATYFVVAWVIYAAALVYLALSVRGFDIGGLQGADVGLLGSAIEGLVLSMALAHRVRYVHKQSREAQDRLIRSLERNNKIQADLVEAERGKLSALMESQSKSQKLAATSHDFASPIQALQASLTTLKSKAKLDTDRQASAIENIAQTLDYLQSLSSSLIIEEHQQQQLALDSFTATDVFVDVFNRYAPVAEEKGLEFYFLSSTATIRANRLAVTRIVENFVSNALRYTAKGKVVLGARRRRGAIEIQVVDTGPGIQAAAQSEIVKAFKQSGDLANEQEGFGLGLSIVHSLCEEFGYAMKLNSTPNKGTMFALRIPVMGDEHLAGSA